MAGTVRVHEDGHLLLMGGRIEGDVIAEGLVEAVLGTSSAGLMESVIAGDLATAAGSFLEFELTGLELGVDYEPLGVEGDVDLGGRLRLTIARALRNEMSVGDTFLLLDGQAVIQGAFSNVANGGVLDLTAPTVVHRYSVHYGSDSRFDPTDVVIRLRAFGPPGMVPEAPRLWLLPLLLFFLARRRPRAVATSLA
jgi:hypothetical protein